MMEKEYFIIINYINYSYAYTITVGYSMHTKKWNTASGTSTGRPVLKPLLSNVMKHIKVRSIVQYTKSNLIYNYTLLKL